MTDNDQLVLKPAIPGYLLLAEIARLAGLEKTTVNNYRSTGAANFPEPAHRSGASPMWEVDTIIDWLARRPHVPTIVEKLDDGSLKVVKSTPWKVDQSNVSR